MATKYWIKLYHEILDDPKVARLNDSTYRRFIECLLLAGEMNKNGLLPKIDDMAWRLRTSESSLNDDMTRLALAGIVELVLVGNEERWFISKFAERQAPMSKAEYMRRKREEKQKQQYHGDSNDDSYQARYQSVTNSNAETDKETDKETDNNGAGTGSGGVYSAYEDNIGSLTPIIANLIDDAIEEFGDDDVIEAIGIAATNGVRKWSYVDGILKKWRTNGKDAPKLSKQDKANKVLSLIRKHSRRGYKDALPELEKLDIDIPPSRWTDLCNARPEQLQWMI